MREVFGNLTILLIKEDGSYSTPEQNSVNWSDILIITIGELFFKFYKDFSP